MIPGEISAQRVFGPPYSGFVRKIRDTYPGVKRILGELTIPYATFPHKSILFNEILISLLDGLNRLYPSPAAYKKARAALSETQATTSTVSFIMHYFKIASKNGISEETAVRNVLEKFREMLLCTAYVPYPSRKGKLLIETLTQPQAEQGETLSYLFHTFEAEEVQTAVQAGFNPLTILNGTTEPPPARPYKEGLFEYFTLSRQALSSYANSLTRYYSAKPNPLWVFLMRDAHLLFLLTEKDLPGKKLELDFSKISLASPEELEHIFGANGYNVGLSKALPPIDGYARIQSEIGARPSIPPPPPADPSAVIQEILQSPPPAENFADNYTAFRRAQQILKNLTVPEQIYRVLESSGIAAMAETGRPIVFVDTGFRGTLPLVLQAALTNLTNRKGIEPSVHTWVDYVQEPYKQFVVNSHRTGEWAVSPLDGCASLNRVLLPAEEGYETDVFTTPFDAVKQARLLKGYLDFTAEAR
ncbi:MAG: hypothetical protein PHH60_03105 [Candidatus Margulisbacteria bacterium]|nr:hypothetical protein [Candidatus Margulisiibacteriota bacterium]